MMDVRGHGRCDEKIDVRKLHVSSSNRRTSSLVTWGPPSSTNDRLLRTNRSRGRGAGVAGAVASLGAKVRVG